MLVVGACWVWRGSLQVSEAGQQRWFNDIVSLRLATAADANDNGGAQPKGKTKTNQRRRDEIRTAAIIYPCNNNNINAFVWITEKDHISSIECEWRDAET